MSTRCNIAIRLKDEDKGKTVKPWNNIEITIPKDAEIMDIYCHFDGYLDGVGAGLLSDFNNYDDVFNMIIKGDMSSLDDHYYGRPNEDWDYIKPVFYKSIKEIFNENGNIPNDYYYLFDNNTWKYLEYGKTSEFRILDEDVK